MKKTIFAIVMVMLSGCGQKGNNPTVAPTIPVAVFPVVPEVIPLPTPAPVGPSSVSLGSNTNPRNAGNYVLIASAGITTTPGSTVVGNMAVSPITGGSITGFGLTMDASNQFSTSMAISGRVYAADYAAPTPDNLAAAVSSMQATYDDAYGRTNPNFTNLGAGSIGGMTLTPGLYKWTTALAINGELVIQGNENDTIILQVAQTVNLGTNARITLRGGIQAKNVVFVAAEAVTLSVGSHFEGVLICKTGVVVQTSASVNGRIYAGTAVTLDNNQIVQK